MNRYATDRFLKHLYDSAPKGQDLMDASPDAVEAAAVQKRARLSEVLGLDRIRALGASGAPETLESENCGSYELQSFSFPLFPDLDVPLFVLKPVKDNGAVLLYLIGHGPGARGVIRPQSDGTVPLPVRFAELGYTVLVPELIGFGDSIAEDYLTESGRGCTANALHLMLHGMTLAGLRVVECERMLDWAAERFPARTLFSYGMSGGGMLNTLMFALESRIQAAVIASYPNTFETSILAMHHCLCNYFPGILQVGDMAQLIALGAPKPVLISSGTQDPIFPLPGTEKCWEDLSRVYRKLGAEDACELELFQGAHEISKARVFDFFQKLLTEANKP